MRKKIVCGGEKHSAWPPLFAVRAFLGKNGAKKRVSAALYHQMVRPLDDITPWGRADGDNAA